MTTTTALDRLLAAISPDRDDDDLCDAIRIAMITNDDRPLPTDYATDLRLLARDERSALALALSLCPLHMIDYAICFDDDDAECAAIRSCFPSHDT